MATLGELQERLVKTPVGANVDAAVLLGYINERIEAICRDREWTRLEKEFLLATVAAYQTGTVSIAAGATSGTGSGTVFTSAMTGRLIRPASLDRSYTFTYVSATAFTIERAYEELTDAVDVSFAIWQPIYELPDDLAEIRSLETIAPPGDLEERPREWLDRYDPARNLRALGYPVVYVPAEDSAAGLAQIELYPGPDVVYNLPGRYYAKAPLFDVDDPDTAAKIPDWISIPCLYAGTLSDLYRLNDQQSQATVEEQRYEKALAVMRQEDARKRPPTQMQPADRFTEHRRERANRGRTTRRNWNSANGN